MTEHADVLYLNCMDDAPQWAAEVLRLRFEEILSLRDYALQTEDIEGVHKMRVATRRLRSALRDFSHLLKKRPLKKAQKDLKSLADALGEARDLDVAIAELEKLCDKAKRPNIKNAIEKRTAKLRAKRDSKQTALIETLAENEMEDLRARFLGAIEKASGKEQSSGLSVSDAGREVIFKSLREFCDLSNALYNPYDCEKLHDNRENLHELRIVAKRLRYAVELFTVCWGERIAPSAVEIARLQGFLGDVHDSDLWIADIRRCLRKKKDKKNRADLWLLSQFVKKRTRNYRAALALWSRWQKNDFIKNFREVLKAESVAPSENTG